MTDFSYMTTLYNNENPGPGEPLPYDPGAAVFDPTDGVRDQYSALLDHTTWQAFNACVSPAWLITAWWSVYNQLGGTTAKAQLTALTNQLQACKDAGKPLTPELLDGLRAVQARIAAEKLL